VHEANSPDTVRNKLGNNTLDEHTDLDQRIIYYDTEKRENESKKGGRGSNLARQD